MRARRRTVVTTYLLVASVLAAACGSADRSTGASAGGHTAAAGAPSKLEGKELLYGATPTEQGPIVYQPDVVFLGGGADAIKEVSSDALVWTIDGSAPHADEVKQGVVLFASSFGAGRVLAVEAAGSDKRVALGPVALTDIIKDGTLGNDEAIPLEGFQAYNTPDQPGLVTETEDDDAAPGEVSGDSTPTTTDESTTDDGTTDDGTTDSTEVHNLRALNLRAVPAGRSSRSIAPAVQPTPKLQPPTPAIPSGKVGNWNFTSICCTSNGIHVTYENGGARVQGTAQVKFDAPSIKFNLEISGGKVVDASVRLNGAASLSFGISAAVMASSDSFRSGRVQLPVNIAIPIPIGNIPVNIGIQQLFTINLGLSGTASLSTEGEYSLGGSLGFAIHNGSPSVLTPTLATTKSALDNIHSLAVAPQGLTFAYAIKTSIGIGPPGLSAGIWYQMSAALSLATSGAQLDPIQGTSLVTCKTVSLSVLGRYGVGYEIPAIVAKAINLFLNAIFTKPTPVQASGGPSWGPTVLYQKSTPPCSNSRGQG